jgi:hypothetical protein
MRLIPAFILVALSLTVADDATMFGQKITFSGQVKYGTVYSKTLYITGSSPFYLVDSTNTPASRVRLDTALNTVGVAGASSASIPIQSVASISQQSNCELSYKIRATDVAQASVLLTAYGQYKTPWTDTDSEWTAQAYLWGQDTVILTHTPPAPTVAWSTRRWFFMPSGDNFRLNIQRVNVGTGDTVVIKSELRCR